MKAIQIKYLGATNTKGARLKAWTEAGTLTVPINYGLDTYAQALELAEQYIKERDWKAIISGFGTLPSGDYVATLAYDF